MRQGLAPTPMTLRHRRVGFWFGLTLLYATVLAVLTWAEITEQPFYIPDDARQHVFWMQRFVDPELFPNDWIADYFQSVAPLGFAWIYRGAAMVGIPPLTFNAILPALLIELTAIAIFFTCLELCALPAAGFAASVLLAQSIEYTSSVASGTPKAFVFLVTLLFWYGWLRRSWWLTGASILLQGLFYPPTVLLSAGVLMLGLIERRPGGHWQLVRDRRVWQLTGTGLVIAAGIILQYGLSSSEFGPTITAAAALEMPEFYRGGRGQFFRPSVIDYLLYGRSGLQLYNALTPVTNVLALAFPILLGCPKRFPLITAVRPPIGLLWRVLATSAVWFVIAHRVLFKLHLPNRYVGRFLLLIVVVLAAIALVIIIDGLLQWSLQSLTAVPRRRYPFRAWGAACLASGLALALSVVLVLYPLTYQGYPSTSLARGQVPELYQFFATQPKASVVASLSAEASNIPSFSGRMVLVNSEIALPYHVGYYREIERRARDLIEAQFTPDPSVLQAFIQRYGITHWLIGPNDMAIATLVGDRWVQQYQPEANQAILTLAAGQVPALVKVADRCTIVAVDGYVVLDAPCIYQSLQSFP
jgi:hypothetical protein